MNPKRILLMDDDPAVTRSLKLNLECTLRYDVRAENDARACCLRPPASPGLDPPRRRHAGHGRLRSGRPHQELKDTPIVFLTALATNKDTRGHTTIAGSTVYLAKPVMLDELIRCIEAYARK